MKVASQPVEFGDDERCPLFLAHSECAGEFGATFPFPALDLSELTDDLPIALLQEV